MSLLWMQSGNSQKGRKDEQALTNFLSNKKEYDKSL